MKLRSIVPIRPLNRLMPEHRLRATSLALALAVTLTACATDALRTAPPRPDAPWQPATNPDGSLRAGPRAQGALALPPGFVLPANTTIHTRPSATVTLDFQRDYALADLIDLAQSNNPSTRRAWDAARDAALAVGIARSAYLPSLIASVVGGYSHSRTNGANPSISNGGEAGNLANQGIGTVENAIGGVQNRSSGTGEVQTLGLQWLLFDFGERDATIASARQAQIAANVLFTAAHQRVIYGVTMAYYQRAAAKARLGLVVRARDNARAVQSAAESRLRNGVGTAQDAAQARQATAQDELRLVQAEGAVEDSENTLMTAMGLSPQTRLRVADTGGRHLTQDDARLSQAMIEHAVQQRPDVLAAYAAARAAEAHVTAATAEFLPKIFVTGNVAYSTGDLALSSVPGIGSNSQPTLNVSSNAFSSVILGGISVPVFDGGMRAALLKQAQDHADAARATLRQTVDDSVKEIVTAQNALRTALAAYTAATRLRDAAQTTFDAAFTAYRSGAGAITQADIAQNGLLDATTARSDAYYAALMAAASLAFATGSLGDAEAASAPLFSLSP